MTKQTFKILLLGFVCYIINTLSYNRFPLLGVFGAISLGYTILKVIQYAINLFKNDYRR